MVFRSATHILILSCLLYISCVSFPYSDRTEGCVSESFRVYVRIDSIDIPESMSDSELDKHLLEAGKIRYLRLWKEIFQSRKNTPDKTISDFILDSSTKGSLMYRREKRDYAEAYADFPMDKILKEYYISLFPAPEKDEDDDE
jgi:hypothetical protein